MVEIADLLHEFYILSEFVKMSVPQYISGKRPEKVFIFEELFSWTVKPMESLQKKNRTK